MHISSSSHQGPLRGAPPSHPSHPSRPSSPHTSSTHTALALLALAAGAAGTACSKSEAATARPEAVNGSAARDVGGSRSEVAAGAKSETENYSAEIKAGGPYKAGAEGAVEVFLTPKGGYHTNAQYPYKFKLDAAPEGVTFPKPLLARADGSFEEKKGYFKVPFTATKAGTVTIAGTLSLSVCSDANCFIDKVALEVPVDVK
jgi:hypothetical protein